MQRYTGSCHCGNIAFAAEGDLKVCQRKGKISGVKVTFCAIPTGDEPNTTGASYRYQT